METTARKFENVNSELQTMLTGLMNRLEVLRSAWQGAGGRSFERVKTSWGDNQKLLQRALEETATAIRISGQQYSATDAEAASRVGGTDRGGIQLPL